MPPLEAPLIEMVIPVKPITADWKMQRKRKKKKTKKDMKPEACEQYRNAIRKYAAKHTPISLPLTELIEVEYTIFVTGNQYGKVGDHDNYSKPLGDALQGVLWMDDNQIKRGTTEVIKVEHKEEQRIEIRVWPYYPGGRFVKALQYLQQVVGSIFTREKETT